MRNLFNKIILIIKILCAVLLVLLIAVLALQRFSDNKIAVGGFRVFNVVTTSMIPVYDVGDIVVVKNIDPDELKVGDDITYLGKEESFKNRVVTHRLIQIQETAVGKKFLTQGVANEAPDPVIEADQIYGKVIYKCLVISALAKLMNNMTLFYIVVFIPLAILVMLQIKDTIKDHKVDEDDDEDEEDDDDDDEEDDDEDDE